MKENPMGDARLFRPAYGVRLAYGVFFGLAVSTTPVSAATVVVTNVADGGPGSFRQAILDANKSPSATSIHFAVPGSVPAEIALESPLPAITSPVTIDATTQPGYAGRPLVALNGARGGPNAHGLHILAGNSTVRGLVIGGFSGAGILLAGSGGNLVVGNFIGTDRTGTRAAPNGSGILIDPGSTDNTIGGTSGAEANLIAGNKSHGLSLGGAGNVIQGNFIGNKGPSDSAPANGEDGVYVSGGTNTIGGPEPGARNVISGNRAQGIRLDAGVSECVIENNLIVENGGNGVLLTNAFANTIGGAAEESRNVISGNSQSGISLLGSEAAGNVIQGNFIGTDLTGAAPFGNGLAGVFVLEARANTIGGEESGAGNVLSGNRLWGISLGGADHVVQGNLVGTDCRGLSPLPNGLPSSGGGGILVSGEGHTIGGTTAGQRNVISANDDDGVRLHAASGVVIQGNFIGTDRTGTRALGNALNGVFLADGSSNNTIGGTTPGERNWICANGQAGPRQAIGTPVNLNRSQEAMVGRPSGTNALGLSLQGGVTLAGEGTSNNVVQGNWIGLTVDGRSPLPNSPAGVMLYAGANQNLIGGLAPGEGNRIAFNSGGGILGVHDNTTGNSILGNAIYGNNGLGISLTPLEAIDLPTPNDNLDPDTGPNNLQNFPTITNVSYSSGATLVEGVLRSTPDQTFAIQIFHNTSPDPSGYGEGEVYAGLATVTADDQGIAGFSFLASGDLPARYFTATATDLDSGDTSEFSPVVRDIRVPPALSIHDTLVAEGSNGTATAVFTVSLSADSTQTVSVSYSTVNGAALAGSDYLATNGLLSFNPGEVSKTIEVIVTADPQPEPDEDFFVDLRNPANATLAEGTGRCLITELRITSIEVAETSLLISFTTSAGQPDLAYCLERASHLRPSADWTAVASGTGTGSIITLTNAGGGSLRTGYYRVLRQPVSDFRFPIADLRVARP